MSTTNEHDGVILHFSGNASAGQKVKVFNSRTKAEVSSISSDARLLISGFTLVCDAANIVQVFDDTGAADDATPSASATLGTALIDGSFPANGGQSTTLAVPFGFKPGMRPTIKASAADNVRFVATGRIVRL